MNYLYNKHPHNYCSGQEREHYWPPQRLSYALTITSPHPPQSSHSLAVQCSRPWVTVFSFITEVCIPQHNSRFFFLRCHRYWSRPSYSNMSCSSSLLPSLSSGSPACCFLLPFCFCSHTVPLPFGFPTSHSHLAYVFWFPSHFDYVFSFWGAALENTGEDSFLSHFSCLE